MGAQVFGYAVGAAALLAAAAGSPPAGGTPPPLNFRPFAAPTSLNANVGASGPTGIVANMITSTVKLTTGPTIGALYDRTTGAWSEIAVPNAGSTAAYGPAVTSGGYRIVGSFKPAGSNADHAFYYDSRTRRYVTIDPPADFCAPSQCNEVIAHSNFGDAAFKVVGNCDTIGQTPSPGTYPVAGHAFLYDSSTKSFTKIDVANSLSTTAYGIWSDPGEVAVAGGFTDKLGTHGYVRGLTSKTMLVYDHPGAVITHFEGITGAGGAGDYNLAGDFVSVAGRKEAGFFLPVRNWVAGKPVLLGTRLSANSVYKRTVVGVKPTMSPSPIGFIVDVPGR
jgi:hypothetical protein